MSLWPEGRRVLVTGASGFIGQALVPQMAQEGWALTLATRVTLDTAHAVSRCRLDEHEDWRAAVQGCEVVVHLGACMPAALVPPPAVRETCIRTNVEGTLNLAHQAARAGVRRFVFMSTAKVHGESGAFREADTPRPQGVYAQSKWLAERGLLEIASETGMEVVIIRPPLVYGPGVKGNFATLVNLVRRRIPLPLGRVRNQRSFIALDNLVEFICLCADATRTPQAANQVLLVSDAEDVSTPKLLQRIAVAYGLRPLLLPVPATLIWLSAAAVGRSSAAHRLLGTLQVDSSHARRCTGWRPRISMNEQLRRMACGDART